MVGGQLIPSATLLVVVVSGCSLLTGPTAPAGCGFPADAALSFAGEASLAELGLGDGSIVGGGAITDRTIGQIYVSRDPIPYAGSIPDVPGDPIVVPDYRQYCADFGDAMTLGGVPDDWTPPRAR